MATEAQATGSGLEFYRLTVTQFEKMIEAGVFPDDARVELLGGMLVTMVKYEPHNVSVGLVADTLRGLLPAGYHVREEKSARLGRYWRPEPDVAIVRGQWRDYGGRGPAPRDLVLAVEVSDRSSYRKDRSIKWPRYAAAGIPVYWIVNLAERRIEVYVEPTGRGRAAAYRDGGTFGEDGQVPVVIEGNEVGRLAVRDVLP